MEEKIEHRIFSEKQFVRKDVISMHFILAHECSLFMNEF